MSSSKDSHSDTFDITKCLRCAKIIGDNQNSISCDKCNGWLHIRCAGLKLKEFKKISSDDNSTFICRYCDYYRCGKCSKPVYPTQNGIQCDTEDVCEKWYHLRCTKFTMAEYLNTKSRLHTETWNCPSCTNIPFHDLSDKVFLETVKPDLKLNDFFKSVPAINSFKTRCSVCTRKITKNQQPKSIPCRDCNTLVHRKCCNISFPDLLKCKPNHLKNWSCNTCLSHLFPFQDISTSDLQKLIYNNIISCPCQNGSFDLPTTSCEEFRSTNFYDNDATYTTGPDRHNNMDITLDINAQCNTPIMNFTNSLNT